MRHVLGGLGLLAAAVFIAVSAAMNWRFGFQLATTDVDGYVYASASAAADAFKALLPFFFVAAWRNRMWAQFAASAVIWLVVTCYSLTSALGFAALNRDGTTSARATQATAYQNAQATIDDARKRLSWIPKHRPAGTVAADMATLEARKPWTWSNGCTQIKGGETAKLCTAWGHLSAEHASAVSAADLTLAIAKAEARRAAVTDGVTGDADPQAVMLRDLASAAVGDFDVATVQTALAVFIALLLELGSGLGLYVACSVWGVRAPKRSANSVQPSQSARGEAPRAAGGVVTPVAKQTEAEQRPPAEAAANDVRVPSLDDLANDEDDLSVSARPVSADIVRLRVRQPAPACAVADFFETWRPSAGMMAPEAHLAYAKWALDHGRPSLTFAEFMPRAVSHAASELVGGRRVFPARAVAG